MSCALTAACRQQFWRRKEEKRNTGRANDNTLELHTEPKATDAVKIRSAGLPLDEKESVVSGLRHNEPQSCNVLRKFTPCGISSAPSSPDGRL